MKKAIHIIKLLLILFLQTAIATGQDKVNAQLWRAVEANKEKKVRELLAPTHSCWKAKKLIPSVTSHRSISNTTTLLHLVAISGYANLIPLLCEHGAELEAKTMLSPKEFEHLVTPLECAVYCGQLECTESLLAMGAHFSPEILCMAAQSFNPTMFSVLLVKLKSGGFNKTQQILDKALKHIVQKAYGADKWVEALRDLLVCKPNINRLKCFGSNLYTPLDRTPSYSPLRPLLIEAGAQTKEQLEALCATREAFIQECKKNDGLALERRNNCYPSDEILLAIREKKLNTARALLLYGVASHPGNPPANELYHITQEAACTDNDETLKDLFALNLWSISFWDLGKNLDFLRDKLTLWQDEQILRNCLPRVRSLQYDYANSTMLHRALERKAPVPFIQMLLDSINIFPNRPDHQRFLPLDYVSENDVEVRTILHEVGCYSTHELKRPIDDDEFARQWQMRPQCSGQPRLWTDDLLRQIEEKALYESAILNLNEHVSSEEMLEFEPEDSRVLREIDKELYEQKKHAVRWLLLSLKQGELTDKQRIRLKEMILKSRMNVDIAPNLIAMGMLDDDGLSEKLLSCCAKKCIMMHDIARLAPLLDLGLKISTVLPEAINAHLDLVSIKELLDKGAIVNMVTETEAPLTALDCLDKWPEGPEKIALQAFLEKQGAVKAKQLQRILALTATDDFEASCKLVGVAPSHYNSVKAGIGALISLKKESQTQSSDWFKEGMRRLVDELCEINAKKRVREERECLKKELKLSSLP